MTDTRFTIKHSFNDVLEVIENLEHVSQFTLKSFGPLATLKKETHKTFDILSKNQSKEQPIKCGLLEITGKGDNKTEIKFSQDFTESQASNSTGLDRFFYLLMQQFIQRGMKTFDK